VRFNIKLPFDVCPICADELNKIDDDCVNCLECNFSVYYSGKTWTCRRQLDHHLIYWYNGTSECTIYEHNKNEIEPLRLKKITDHWQESSEYSYRR
jgi:hypothetical protein